MEAKENGAESTKKQALKKNVLKIFFVAFALSVTGFVLNGLFGSAHPRLPQMFSLLMIVGNTGVMMATVMLAQAKGRNWQWGFLGLFNWLGFALVWFLLSDRPAKS